MLHLMIDLETAGNTQSAAILSIGIVEFDLHSGEIGRRHRYNVDLNSCIALGMKIEPDTFKWWLQQSDSARKAVYESDDTVKIQLILENLPHIITKKHFVWANSPRFDLGILQTAYNLIGKPIPWNFRNERDVRTIVSLVPPIESTNTLPHDPIADCIHQIKLVTEAYKQIKQYESKN